MKQIADISDQPSGIYVLQATNDQGCIILKLIKE
jgi:hypothetical protein